MNEIYAAIYNRLNTQLTEDVYDHIPQDLNNNSYPFVRLDPLKLEDNDSDTENAFIATVQVIGFSRYRGSKEIADLAQSVYNSLHNYSFANTASYGISGIHQTVSEITMLDDGLTRSSIQRFTLYFEPLPA